MGVPKKKLSKSRTKRRRSEWLKIKLPAISICPKCKSVKMPHVVCPNCGFYKGREILPLKSKVKKELKKSEK